MDLEQNGRKGPLSDLGSVLADAVQTLARSIVCAGDLLGTISPSNLSVKSIGCRLGCLICCLVTFSTSLHIAYTAELSPDDSDFFERRVRPLLVQRCLECHASTSDEIGGNLLLDRRDGWLQGGDSGPAIVPGDAAGSLLVQAIRHTHPELQMPPGGKLSPDEIRQLEAWIERGAPDPRGEAMTVPLDAEQDFAQRRNHWAFQPPHPQPLPEVGESNWPTNAIDFFVLSQLQQHGVTPVATADRRTLMRRVTFDLTGLPPTPADVMDYLHDGAPDAYERLVDRLLASPRYGERWGRFWLDVARYADSNGLDENIAHGNAWRYRDYVVNSFNQDKAFDDFIREQIAGDLLPSDSSDLRNERTTATGFLSLGPKVLAEVDETKMEMDIIDEQVETVGRAFMALTLGCARCHDHKFDPISIDDYYALAGIFKSTKTMEHFTKIARWMEVPIPAPTQQAAFDACQRRIEELRASLAGVPSEMQQPIRDELGKYEAKLAEFPTAMGVVDQPGPHDLRVHLRGSFLTLGELIPRRVPDVFCSDDLPQPSFPPDSSGRMELADWLVSGQHPLVARVIVNRLWRWHFGRGIASSTDNFGLLGESPESQPLLDWLAVQLVRNEWSLKQIHRVILLSSTYRLSSQHDARNVAIDPENRFHWRANHRRIEAEAIRDSLLFVSGRLDLELGGSLLHVKNREFLFDHTSKDTTKYDSRRRSIYLPVIRNHLYDAFQLFDYTDASVMTSDRTTTTVASQALFLMNSQLVTEAAVGLAWRVRQTDLPDADSTHAAGKLEGQIDLVYQIALGRPATQQELARGTAFLGRRGSPMVELDTARTLSVSRNTDPAKSDEAGERVKNDTLDQAWFAFCQAILMSNEFVHVR